MNVRQFMLPASILLLPLCLCTQLGPMSPSGPTYIVVTIPTEAPPPTSQPAPTIPPTSLDEKWSSFLTEEILAISIGREGDEGSLVVALLGKEGHLVLLKDVRGEWIEAWSFQVEMDEWARLLLADMDGDGVQEIMVSTGRVNIYQQSGEAYSLAWTSPEAFDTAPPPNIGVADVDGDGINELAVMNYGEEKVAHSLVVYGSATGGPADLELASAVTLTDPGGYHYIAGMALADFNQDGVSEIVAGNDNGALWLISYSGGGYEVAAKWQVPEGGAISSGVATGDLDRNGKPELLVGTNGGYIYVYTFDEALQQHMAATAVAGRLAYGVAAGDVDGDGVDEFVLGRGYAGYAGMTAEDVVVEVWELTGNELQRVWSQQAADVPRPIPYDLDNDGRAEIVVLGLMDGVLDILSVP